MKIRILSALILLTLVLAGCTSDSRPPANQTWLVESLTVNGEEWDISTNNPLTLELSGGKQVGGSSGCNSYFGELEFKKDGQVTPGMFGGTEMACEVGMDIEAAFLNAISRVDSYTYSEYVLTLSADDGATVIIFQLMRTM